MAIKGINTAPLIHNNRFLLMALKIRDNNNQEHLFFMQIPTLIDFLIVLRHSTFRISQRLAMLGEEFKTKLIAANEDLASNVPVITQAEITQPDQGLLVTSIAPKVGENCFSLIACMHNEHITTIEIDDSQAEFIITAVKKAIEFAKDEEALNTIGVFMSFMLLYDVNLTDINNLKYNELKHEPWKQQFFSHNLAVLYCFDTDEGKKILAGNVIKINSQPNSHETEAIVKLVSSMSPTSKPLKDRYKLCDTFTRVINAPSTKALTKDECLRALHTFCVETNATLEH